MLAREIIEDSILSYLTSEVLADDIDDNELSQKVLVAKTKWALYIDILKDKDQIICRYFYPIVE